MPGERAKPKGPIMNVTDLRKAFSAQGIKGFSSANRATFTAAIEAAEVEAHAEDAARKPVAKAPARNADFTLRGKCADGCGRPITKSVIGPELCDECLEYAEWENTHSDQGHEDQELDEAETNGCPVCHPELDPRNVAPKMGRSRAGMVIVAKGSEFHKSLLFKREAEAKGWTVEITRTVEIVEEDGEEFEIEKHTAIATRGEEVMTMKWNGRAYDYAASSALLKGKARKVRNLKEALRLI